VLFRSRGGGHNRNLLINNNDPYTADNRVNVTANFSIAGISEIYYLRYSSQITALPFSLIASIDSALKKAAAANLQYVTFGNIYRIWLADSLIYDQGGINIGKFGGLYRIKTDFDSLVKAFGTVTRDTAFTDWGDTGWVRIEKRDTLPAGPGGKWVYLYNPAWALPLSDSIGIRPYNMEVMLDEANARIRRNSASNSVCLLSDDVPILVNTFGDTSFDDEVWVWLATLNLSPAVFNAGQFLVTSISYSGSLYQGAKFAWPEALLETPPEQFKLQADGRATGILNSGGNPDYYENHYRVSPLDYVSFVQNPLDSAGAQGFDNTISSSIKYINRGNSSYLGQMMNKGSILGYSETRLGNFNGRDYVLCRGGKGLQWFPYVGWFEVAPLAVVAPDSMYNPYNLTSVFSDMYGISKTDVDSGFNTRPQSKFYSIYSAYFYRPDPKWGAGEVKIYNWNTKTGVKLYKNPMRSLPYFLSNNMSGSKEFILCVYGRGKYFKEPRAMMSIYSTPTSYCWDKTPPHLTWDADTSIKSPTYAPMYYSYSSPVTNQLKTSITDLGKTPIPYVFDVWLSACDKGFGQITSAKLCFNYSTDLIDIDPLTGYRTYSKNSIKIDVDPRYFGAQGGGCIEDAAFRNIDARLWQGGLWDMWLETEDDLQNKGIAPLWVPGSSYDPGAGLVTIRQIRIY
jgi:hypothetical protein